MEVIIDDEKIPMKGDTILYIPLGSNHGVEVTGDRHMHYMWIDFMPDNELGLARLEASHKPTGKWNSFSADGKKS
jgi:mannose-6-phosphate isomerase-like protein (cupin superfamily)